MAIKSVHGWPLTKISPWLSCQSMVFSPYLTFGSLEDVVVVADDGWFCDLQLVFSALLQALRWRVVLVVVMENPVLVADSLRSCAAALVGLGALSVGALLVGTFLSFD